MQYSYGAAQLRKGDLSGRVASPVFPTREWREGAVRRAMTEGYGPANDALPSGNAAIVLRKGAERGNPLGYLDRFAGSYDLIGRPIETMTNVPLGGVVRAGLENMGADPMYARYGEQGVAGLLSAGIGISALAAAAQALNSPQTPGTLPLSY